MNRIKTIIVSLSLIALICANQIAYAANEDGGSKKYSLRNLKNYKSTSLNSLTGTYKFKGFQTLPYSTETRYNALVRYDNGNTTYVFPYKVVAKTPKFKTPTRQ